MFSAGTSIAPLKVPSEPRSVVGNTGVDGEGEKDERARELRAILMPDRPADDTLVVLGGAVDPEAAEVFFAALASYREGVDTAAIICTHAACERDLLAHGLASGNIAENKLHRAGLGSALAKYRTVISSPLHAQLTTLNERRKALYHLGHSASATGLSARTSEYLKNHREAMDEAAHLGNLDPKQLQAFAQRQMLRTWAREAIEAADHLKIELHNLN